VPVSPADPRTCGTCFLWARDADRREVGVCTCREAGEGVTLVEGVLETTEGFGCRFWVARDPARWNDDLIRRATEAAYVRMVVNAGRTTLPIDLFSVDSATREQVRNVAIGVLKSAKVLAP
jgi:hypothetical protein